ncbi:unnamed protein product [Gordionus sp. m RMFG-2023]
MDRVRGGSNNLINLRFTTDFDIKLFNIQPHHDPIYKYKTITYNCKRGGTQVKIPETTNLYSQYHFQNIPKNLVPMSRTIPDTIKLSSSQIISKNILGTQAFTGNCEIDTIAVPPMIESSPTGNYEIDTTLAVNVDIML